MATFASITPTTEKDGIAYCTSAPVTTTEADLGTPISLIYHQALVASVALALGGTTSPTYIVLQTDLGDGNWIDVAWLTTTDTTGTDLFLLSAGVAGANAAAQTRAAGTGPSSNGSNQVPLGARFRFVGKTGANSKATVTITYKLLGLR